jgi:hypothetical protein
MITNASREGARAGIVYQALPRLTEDEIDEVVDTYAEAHLITFGQDYDPVTETVPSDGDPDSNGGELKVNVSYTYDFLILPRFVSEIAEDTLTLTATTVMTYEGEY